MKLLSMIDYVLQNKANVVGYKTEEYGTFCYNHLVRIEDYANFLREPLKLEMFIPCDNGEILRDPELTMSQGDGTVYYGAEKEEFETYEKAEEKVIFNDFVVIQNKERTVILTNNEGVIISFSKRSKEFMYGLKSIEDLVSQGLAISYKDVNK